MLRQRTLAAVTAGLALAAVTLSSTAGAATKTTKKAAKTTRAAKTTAKATTSTAAPATNAPATTSAPVTTAARAAIPQDNADPNGTVRIVYPAPASSLDPARDNSVVNKIQTFLVFDRLTQIDNKTRDAAPMLATSWKYAPDGTYLEMKLRDDVNFHDGTKLDANAVKVSLDRYKNAPESLLKGFMTSISGVTVVDPTTIRVNLVKGRGADVPVVLATAVGAVVNPKVLAAGQDLSRNLNNAGSGPYVLDTADPSKGYTYNKAPGTYWDPKAGKLKRIEIQIIQSTIARVNAVRSNAADLAHIQLPEAADALKLANRGELLAYKVPGFMSMHATLFHPVGKLTDVRVRQAISLAIDRVGIAEALVPGADPEIQPYPAGHWANVPGLEAPRWDPIKAKQMIKDAGAEGFSFKLGAGAGTPFELIALQIQSQMKDIGLNITIVPLPPGSQAFQNGEVEASQAAIVPSPDPATLLNDLYYDTGPLRVINDPAALARIKAAAAPGLDPSLTDAQRGAVYQGVFKTLAEELWAIPIARTFQTWAYTNPKLKGVEDMGWIWSGVFDARTLWVTK